jgi:hypothetical protein
MDLQPIAVMLQLMRPAGTTEATKLVSSDRPHNSSQDVDQCPVNSLRPYDRQSNERHTQTGDEPEQSGF